ncbi:hypothetical protein Zmor_002277 [Zophobas morio]|uniref:Uncharacterized protein n=1 Tax=Zophobas morio TaxID=2755281 RepID=A0AA38MTG2_9CUCU|nr:hypothetical protein Zmor_002277 [Zophobas morio]
MKTRTQKLEESLQEFEVDAKRLIYLAYSDAPPTFQERFAIETLVNGIRDVEVKKVLQLSRYQTSFEALIRALEVAVSPKAVVQLYCLAITIDTGAEVSILRRTLEDMGKQT